MAQTILWGRGFTFLQFVNCQKGDYIFFLSKRISKRFCIIIALQKYVFCLEIELFYIFIIILTASQVSDVVLLIHIFSLQTSHVMTLFIMLT